MSRKYISPTDTAKLLRAALKESFPGTKFSVRTSVYSGGASIHMSWTDGPTSGQVDSIARTFAGASFDGMTDSKSYHSATLDGVEVHFGADYVFANRHCSNALIERSINAIGEKFNVDVEERPSATAFDNGLCRGMVHAHFGFQDWSEMIHRDASRRTRCTGPAPSPTLARLDAPKKVVHEVPRASASILTATVH